MTANVLYRSDDTSAPTLTGTVGSLTALLDAILVNGYGSKSAAGWAIPYTATNKRVYQAPTGAGNRFPLQVDDANTLAAGAQYARTVAYESMTAITTGTAPVPTGTQVSGGLYVQKSITADTTVRPWFCVANDRYFKLYIYAGQTAYTSNIGDCTLEFGDILSDKAAAGGTDAYATIHCANPTSGSSISSGGSLCSGGWTATPGCYIVRPYTQVCSSSPICRSAMQRGSNSAPTTIGNDAYAPNFPDPVTGEMLVTDVQVLESGGASIGLTRGRIPGYFNLNHNPTSLASAYNPMDTIAGTGAFSGVTFLLYRPSNGPASVAGYAAIQATGTPA